jgi:hypothetical protein
MINTYQVIGFDGDDWKVEGTISMDDAGIITYTATPGSEAMMAELMDVPASVYDPEHADIRHVPKPGQEDVPTRREITPHSDPKLWFEQLPAKYHGTYFWVEPLEPLEKPGKVREHPINPRRHRKLKP